MIKTKKFWKQNFISQQTKLQNVFISVARSYIQIYTIQLYKCLRQKLLRLNK